MEVDWDFDPTLTNFTFTSPTRLDTSRFDQDEGRRAWISVAPSASRNPLSSGPCATLDALPCPIFKTQEAFLRHHGLNTTCH